MSLLLLYRPYRWRRSGADGGGASKRKRDTVVFKIPKPGAKKSARLGKREVKDDLAGNWTNWLTSAVQQVQDSAPEKFKDSLADTKSLISRIELVLTSVVMVPDGALLSLDAPDPELSALLDLISKQLAVYASDEEALLLFMLMRRR